MSQFQPPSGQWVFVPAPPLPVHTRTLPVHDWYDYVIAGVALAYILLVFAVQALAGVTI